MGIFSNGQFDVKQKGYLFDRKNCRFVSADKINLSLVDYIDYRVFLSYKSFEIMDPDLKIFELELMHNGKLVKKADGHISKLGPNTNYESEVRNILKEATELSSKEN